MDTRSTGEVVASLIVNTQAMVAKEVELVGFELRRLVARKLTAIAVLMVGAIAGVGVVVLGAATAAIALEDVLAERWMAWGAVTLAVAAFALILFLIAARTLAGSWSPRARRSARSTPGEWLSGLGKELTGELDGEGAGDVEDGR